MTAAVPLRSPSPPPAAVPDPVRDAILEHLLTLDAVIDAARPARLELARRDFTAFVEYCFRDRRQRPIRQAEFHVELQTAVDEHPFVFAELPRDHGKTTQLVVYRILWWLGRNPNETIKIATETDRQARKRIREISEHIKRNERLHEVFPHLRPADFGGWTQHSIYVQRAIVAKDASVEAYGIGSGVIGDRATKMIFDDVTKPRSVRSRAAREEVKEAIYSVWLPMVGETWEDEDWLTVDPDEDAEEVGPLDDEAEDEEEVAGPGEDPEMLDLPVEQQVIEERGGQLVGYVGPEGAVAFQPDDEVRVVWIGTPWHTDDAHCDLKETAEARGWFVYSKPVGGEWARERARARGEPEDDFSPVWPERWPRKLLRKRRRRLGSIHFARGYHLRPISPEDSVWSVEDFRFLDWADVPDDDEIMGVVAAWDFAFSTKTRADWTAYVCIAITYDGQLLVFRASRFRKGLVGTAEAIVEWWQRDRVDHLGMEFVQAQVWMGEYSATFAPLPIRGMRPKVDKVSRAIQTQPYVEQRRVHFLPGTEDLQAELEAFPLGKHDDLADCFVYCVLLAVEYYFLGEGEMDEADDAGGGYEDQHCRVTSFGGGQDGAAEEGDEIASVPESVLDRVFAEEDHAA